MGHFHAMSHMLIDSSMDSKRPSTSTIPVALRTQTIHTGQCLPTEAGTLSGHTGTVYAFAFNQADRTLATTGANHTIRLWQSDLRLVRERLCAMAAPEITPDEWKTHFPEADYQPPCTGN